jgi:aspartate kinase
MKEDETMEDILVSGVAYNRDESRITLSKVPDKPGIAAAIFNPISSANIVVDMIIQNTRAGDLTDMTFTVPRNDFSQALDILKSVADEIGAESITGDDTIAKVSIIGVGMRNHSGVATRMFNTLARHNINVSMISTSEIKISCVIDEKYTELAVRALHEEFELDKQPVTSEQPTT